MSLRRLLGAIVLILPLAGGACSRAPARPAEFRVGLIGVFTGPWEGSSGRPGLLGAQLAVEALNAAGGVTIRGVPHRVVLIDKRIEPRPSDAAIAARELINLDSVDVIVGPQASSLAIPAGAVAEVSQVPMVAPMASSPEVTDGRQMVSRLAFLDAQQGEVLARYAFDSLGARRAAALHDEASRYGRDIVRLFEETFEAAGGTMTGVETFSAEVASDHATQIARLVSRQPDVLLLPNFLASDSLQIRSLRRHGFTGRLLGSDTWDAIALSRRAYVDGAVIVANWDRRADRPGLQRFLTAWNAAYQEPARATAAATYDAITLLAAAASRADTTTGARVMEAFRTAGAVDGAFTQYRFNGTGDPARGAVVLRIDRDSTHVVAVTGPSTP